MPEDREERRERGRDRDREREDINDLLDVELKALEAVLDAIQELHILSRMRVLRAAEALLPPQVSTTPAAR